MHKFFSAPRMNRYNHNQKMYIQNIQECQRVYLKLNVFEITIRNKINDHFSAEFGSNWLIDINYDHENSFNFASSTPSNCRKRIYDHKNFDKTKSRIGFMVGIKTYNKIATAKSQIKASTYTLNNDSIMGSLTFGFWSGIFDTKAFLKHYRSFNKTKSDNLIINVLGVAPADIGNHGEVIRKTNELNRIRDFRNRVFHYENILNHIADVEKLIDNYIVFFDENNKLQNFIKEVQR